MNAPEPAYTPKAGAEAEELRAAVELALEEASAEDYASVLGDRIRRALDAVDARDSLRWLEDRDALTARIAELESRPGYDAAVRACARIVEGSVVPENAHRSILALLEPKP